MHNLSEIFYIVKTPVDRVGQAEGFFNTLAGDEAHTEAIKLQVV